MQILRQYGLWGHLPPQPDREAREVFPGYSLPLDDVIWERVGRARGIFETLGGGF